MKLKEKQTCHRYRQIVVVINKSSSLSTNRHRYQQIVVVINKSSSLSTNRRRFVGMVKPKNKEPSKSKTWQGGDIENALAEIRQGKSIRSSAKKYGIAESALQNRMALLREGKEMMGSGRRTVLTQEQESSLSKCIDTLCNSGFSPSADEIKNLVRDYVRSNHIKTPFKEDRPGREWFTNFLKRNRLSTKKATIISAARKAATSNPFIVYDFYEKLEEVMRKRSFESNQI